MTEPPPPPAVGPRARALGNALGHVLAPFVWCWRSGRWLLGAPRRWAVAWSYRRRMTLIREVAGMVRYLDQEEESRMQRLQIMLKPESWPGAIRRCDQEDGGCGLKVTFPPLKMQRHGERESWFLVCPHCRKQRVLLQTRPGTRVLQARALEEYRQTGDLGPAYARYEQAVLQHNQRLLAARLKAGKKGAGPGVEMAMVPPDADPDAAPDDGAA